MEQNNIPISIKEKLRQYDAVFKQLSELGKNITTDLEESLNNNYNSFDNFKNSVNELNSKFIPFMDKYNEITKKFDEFNYIKKEFEELTKKTAEIYSKMSNFSFPQVNPMMEDLNKILEYLPTIQSQENNLNSDLKPVKEGIQVISKYFNSLKKSLEDKINISINSEELSKKGIDDLVKKIYELQNPELNLNIQQKSIKKELPNEDNKKIIEESSLTLESQLKNDTAQYNQNEKVSAEEIIEFMVNEIIINEKNGIRYQTILDKYENRNAELVIRTLENEGIIIGDNRSKSLSPERIKIEEKKVLEAIEKNANIYKEKVLKTISQERTTNYKYLFNKLCYSSTDKTLLSYELRKMKESGEIICEDKKIKLKKST
ncbi:MAG: hypothetical protein PHN56_01835 [Candidatus Nanoarchaeia archaeon]|nr:hypothetical protein [Candidatus Nanoarchaeia archaeon]